jgi:hypothetical protein
MFLEAVKKAQKKKLKKFKNALKLKPNPSPEKMSNFFLNSFAF